MAIVPLEEFPLPQPLPFLPKGFVSSPLSGRCSLLRSSTYNDGKVILVFFVFDTLMTWEIFEFFQTPRLLYMIRDALITSFHPYVQSHAHIKQETVASSESPQKLATISFFLSSFLAIGLWESQKNVQQGFVSVNICAIVRFMVSNADDFWRLS